MRLKNCHWFVPAIALMALVATAWADTAERVSVSTGGTQPSVASNASYVTPNGRYVVFASGANNLVSGDTNNVGDVFVRDLQTNTTSRVSIPDPGTGNTQANSSCYLGRSGVRYCSDDARYVVFVSAANNLVLNDTNGDDPPFHISGTDIFVRDRDLDADGIYDEAGVGNTKTVRVSVTTGESQYIEFSIGLDTYGGGVSNPSISANGRYVAFESQGDNLGGGNGTVGSNIYWRDRDNDGNGIFDESGSTGGGVDRAITRLVSQVSGSGSDGFSHDPAISGDGHHVAFVTASQILVYDSVGSFDSNNDPDVYVRKMSDANSNLAQRVSLRSDETQTNDSGHYFPSISYDGQYVAWETASSQLLPVGQDTNGTTDIYVRDRGSGGANDDYIISLGTTARVSLGVSFNFGGSDLFRQLSSPSTQAFISSTGRYVLFNNAATNVICGIFGCFNTGGFDNIYVRDTLSGSESTKIATLTSAGAATNGDSSYGATSDDASVTSFQSVATNIVSPDNNGALSDVYAYSFGLTANSCGMVRGHIGTGNLNIFLSSTATGNGLSGPGVESRSGGIRQIEVDFSTDATLSNPSAISIIGRTTTAGVMGPPVNYNGAIASAVISADKRTLTLTFNAGALPDDTCYTIELAGALSNSAGALSGDTDVNVRSLYGDTTGSGVVNLSDAVRATVLIGQPSTSYPGVDVNLSGGNISNADMLAAKARITSPAHMALCP